MPAALVVAVEPVPPRPELGVALIAACSSAVRPRDCVLAIDAAAPRDVTVTFEAPDAIRVRAEARAGSEEKLERVLRFRPQDREADQWSAAGLVAAALVEDRERGEPPKPEVPLAEPPPRARAWLAAGGLAGRGLSRGSMRYGGFVGGAYRFTGLPAFVVAELDASRAAAGPGGIEPSWIDAALGLGGILELPRVDAALRLRLEGLVERQGLSRGVPAPDSGGRILDGLRIGLEGAWPVGGAVSVLGGTSAQFLSGGTAARVGGKKVSSFPAHTYGFFLGVEVPIGR